MTEQPKRVCAWCGDRMGEMFVSLEDHTPAGHEATYFCGHDHLQEWLETDLGEDQDK